MGGWVMAWKRGLGVGLVALVPALGAGCTDDAEATSELPLGTGAVAGGTGAMVGMVGTGGVPGSGGLAGTGAMAATGGMPGAGGAMDGSGGATGAGGMAGAGGTPAAGGGGTADYHDPGMGAWERVTPADCGIDEGALQDSAVGTYAIFRYGKLCHMKGRDSVGQVYSVTKTLGGTMAGRAAYLTRDIARSGPGTGTIVPEDPATDWLGAVSYNSDATLSHVMAMVGHNRDLSYGAKSYTYDTIGGTQINTMIAVTEKAIGQVGGLPGRASAFVQQELFDKLGMGSSGWGGGSIATGWTANMEDMGRLGVLLVHDGWYGGEQLVGRGWVYRMSHPAFEDANTSYGHLAWLNHRGSAAGIGGNISSGANAEYGDPCAPAAFWPSYPHGISEAPDCLAEMGDCEQTHDVGVFSAQGLGGQFIVMHPGLDLVIVAKNFSGGDGPLGLWAAVRPGLVAMDPAYAGDEAAFCAAYGAGQYAPDLVLPRVP